MTERPVPPQTEDPNAARPPTVSPAPPGGDPAAGPSPLPEAPPRREGVVSDPDVILPGPPY
jgi:hypothetical protein